MTVEFKETDRVQMTSWIGGKKRYKLLFKATRDGCSAASFHSKCNNTGPTVTILYNTNNSVYGGYTSMTWKSSGTYQYDENAFLFRLYQNGSWSPVKMPSNGGTNAIYDDASYGPTFGGGHTYPSYYGTIENSDYDDESYEPTFGGVHDLHTYNGSIGYNGSYFSLNGYASMGSLYNMNGQNYNTIANGHLQVKDLEVYLVEDRVPGPIIPADTLLTEPWRKTPEWNEKLMNELKTEIERYAPLKELKIGQARFLLIGQVGAGKSSFFNTINSIFRGYITSQACAGNAEHSLTTVYRMYQVRNGTSGKPMNFRLHDTRGLEADQGLDCHEMCYLLDGYVPDRHQFNPSVPISPDTPGFHKNPQYSDKIHCVAFVLDGSTVDVMPEKVIERIKTLQSRMNQRGIPQVVLLTKVDKTCKLTSENLSRIFYSPTIQETVDRVSQVMGIPRSHVLPIKNYESEMELNLHVSILIMLTLRQMLHFADDYMYNILDEHEEGKLQQLNIRE